MRKIGINLDACGGLDAKTYIKLIKDLGFEAAFITPRSDEEILNEANILVREGITLDTIHAPWKNVNNMWCDTDAGEEPLSAFIHYIDLCKETGAPVAIIHLSAGATPPPPTDAGRARFCRLVDYAIGKGIKIAFENQRMLANLAWTFEEFKDVQSVGFCWDTGHEACFTGGRRYMPLFGDRLIATHIHDNDGVYNSDQHRLPFDGVIDFGYIASELKNNAFDGTIMLEVIKREGFYNDLSPEQYLERAAASAKRLREMII